MEEELKELFRLYGMRFCINNYQDRAEELLKCFIKEYEQVKNYSIPAVSGLCECDFSIESRQGVDFVKCVKCGDIYYK
jgi:hypothetical protein